MVLLILTYYFDPLYRLIHPSLPARAMATLMRAITSNEKWENTSTTVPGLHAIRVATERGSPPPP